MTSTPFLISDEVAAFSSANHFGIFFNADIGVIDDIDMTIRLWSGVGDYPVKPGTTDTFTGMESVDVAGNIYYGTGLIDDVPEFEVLINGLMERVTFTMPGVPPKIANNIASDAPVVKGKDVRVGLAPLDRYWQPLGPITPLWFGVADYWSIQFDGGQGDGPALYTMSLSVGTGLTGRSRPRLTSFTNAQQHILYPTDNFFDRVTRYVPNYVVKWPNF